MTRTILMTLALLTGCAAEQPLPDFTIDPDQPITSDELQLVFVDAQVGVSSADSDVSVRWERDGVVVDALGNLMVVPADQTGKGEVWSAFVSKNGSGNERLSATRSVTIGNAPPVATSVQLTPTTAFTDSTIVATIITSDPDGDAVTPKRAWRVNGTLLNVETNVLAGSAFVKGDLVELEVTPNDGDDDGPPITAAVTIQNSLPSITAATISPSEGLQPTSILTCTAVGWSDADGDPEGFRYVWERDGIPVGRERTFSMTDTVVGNLVRCGVTPDDGEELGEMVYSDPVELERIDPLPGDCDAPTLPADPYVGRAMELELVLVSGRFAVDAELNVARGWCAEETAQQVSIDLLLQSPTFQSTGDYAEICSMRLIPNASTVPLASFTYAAPDTGGGPMTLRGQGFTLEVGDFTVEDYPFDVDGDVIGGCLTRTFDSTKWGPDLKQTILDMPWSLSVGDLEAQIEGFMADPSSDDPSVDDDPYDLYQDGKLMGGANHATADALANPYLVAVAYELDEETWTVVTDGDDEPTYLTAADAAPPGAALNQGIFELTALGYWNATFLLGVE